MHEVLSITTGRLNLLLTDGRRLFATRYGNSLHRLGTTLASEPTDDQAAWAEVRDESIVAIDTGGATTASIAIHPL